MSFTYSLSGTDADTLALSRTRLLISDTTDTGHVFEDAELLYFLTLDADPRLAAATAFETWARDRAKLEKRKKVGDTETEQRTASDLLNLAATLRKQARAGGAPVGTFTDPNDSCNPPRLFGISDRF